MLPETDFRTIHQILSGSTEQVPSPLVVTDFETEYWAAKKSALVVDATDRALCRVSGKESLDFLQRMLSNDVKTLAPGETVVATLLTAKGGLIGALRLIHTESGLWIESERSRLSPLSEALSRYIIAEDVTLQGPGTTRSVATIVGPKAPVVLQASFESLDAETLRNMKVGQVHSFDGKGGRSMITATGQNGGVSYQWITEENATDIACSTQALVEAARANGGGLSGAQAADTLRLEQAVPRFGVDVQEGQLPLEASLDHAVSFDKGCYIGQEYVVRLAHRGQLSKKLVSLQLDSARAPLANAGILSGENVSVGHITSAAYSPGLEKCVALAYVKRHHFAPGTELQVEHGEGQIRGVVVG